MPKLKWTDADVADAVACVRESATVGEGLQLYAERSGRRLCYRSFKECCDARGIEPRKIIGGAAVQFARKFGDVVKNLPPPNDGAEARPSRDEREPELLSALVSLTRRKVVTLLEACEALRAAPQDVREAIAWAQREGYHLQVEGDRVFSRLAIQAFEAATLGEPKPGRYRVAHLTDMHFGSRHCDVAAMRDFLRYAEAAGCVAGLCTGDVTDGHSPKLTFDQTAVGLDDQLDVALDAMRGTRLPWFAITGNHDGYHSSNTGIDTGRVTAERMQAAGIDWKHVGVCVGDVVVHGARFHLWHPHGGAGTRNAVRRVMNDRAEDMARNDNVPHALLLGHFHKHTSFTAYPERTFCASGGTFQRKGSEFANRIAREWDIGGSIISFTVGDDGKPREFSAEFQEAS